ncbi:facilitated trehalose transporter Tret1-like [Planococcus citri]|uniref:facilitated trehalose transporter Tret1-like n=1 Tax=Planococcus citri TaxID=170843 RepID=UPI0031F8EA60
MKCQFRITGFTKEITYSLIILTTYIVGGAGRAYLTFLFYQLDFPDSRFKLDADQKTWIASSLGILSPVGSVCSGVIMDFCGRKIYLLITFIPFIISWIIISFAASFEMLFVGMLILGFGIGVSFCVSTYISEISVPKNRGALLGLTEVAYNVGVTVCSFLLYNIVWHEAAIVFAVLSIIFMFSTLLLPESPVWLYSRGKREKSVKILSSLRCSKVENITDEIKDMEKNCEEERKTSCGETLKNITRAWKPFLITIVLFAFLQHTGYSIMVAYTIMIFDRLELPLESTKITIMYSAVGFIGSVATPFFMHRMGRKTVLGLSSFCMGACVIVVGVYEEIFYHQNEKLFAYIVPIAFYVYTLACNIGVLPISFMIGGELFPNEVRGTMNGLYGVFAYAYWALTLKFYPKFMNFYGIKITMWVFAISCFIVSLFAAFILPETHGKTLNEVQEQYFKKKKKPSRSTEEQLECT